MFEDDDIPITLHEAKDAGEYILDRPHGGLIVSEPVIHISGTPNDEPVMYFSLQAWASMLGHAGSRLDCEVGGFLLGQLGKDEKGIFFIVHAAVQAAAATEARASVKFTHASWEYLDAERRLHYAHEKLVGWYHTHPGYGVFYSSYDEFIQKNFFSGSNAFGVVLDPIHKELGLYQFTESLKRRKYWQVFKGVCPESDYTRCAAELITWMHKERKELDNLNITI